VWRAAVLASLCLLLSVGAPAGDLIPPPPDLPDDPVLADPEPSPVVKDEALKDDSWVGPPPGARAVDLKEAVAIALTRNFGILSGLDAVEGARLGEAASLAQFYPKLIPSYQQSAAGNTALGTRGFSLELDQKLPFTGGSIQATGALTSIVSSDPTLLPIDQLGPRAANVTVNIDQPLLRGLGPTATFFDLKNQRRARVGQERSFALARQALAEQVTDAFYQVVRQRQLRAVARGSLERNDKLRRASEARMQAGLASKLDVLRAGLQLSFAQDAMVSAETALQTALEQFRILLGLRPTDNLEPAMRTLNDEPTLDLPPLETLIARALQNRLDLLEVRDKVDDARRARTVARQNLLPQLDLNFQILRTGYGNTYADSIRSMTNQVDVYLSTSYPLERTSDRGQAAMANLAVQGAERALTQNELQVEAEVRAAVRDLERIVKSCDLQKKNVELAAQQHRLATLRYQRGLESNFNVVDAEEKLVSARASLVSLLTQFQVARVHLLRTTGTLNLETEFAL